ncbi:MAG: iron ABC transporter permease [Chloroflexi bacterium]|jgi:iron complex transport system permease protein|nr:iron ABC transporter permease [Anaerolineaceae bacterium]NLI43986.1 iron ABC transporter permease [Chloroflexota bacterium]HOE34292.1 iron ABC transporter permease [Anaerolineaceae bacterium]HOT25868.1 iron ABC transporter permease [Anaerolineaceae bacterium]HQH58017.1 iron ABC transporter permease [Anaerolineaceae bacterium]
MKARPDKTTTIRGPAARGWVIALFAIILAAAFVVSLSLGSVSIPLKDIIGILLGKPALKESWTTIILNFRLTKALTALLAGAALSVAGLQMQTMFRNPLADPFILGINSGASLGVALAVLAIGTTGSILMAGISTAGDLGLAIAASIGAGLVLGLILLVGRQVRNPTTLLILGLMFGYAASAVTSLLIYFSLPERIQAYTVWSYGSFSGVTWSQLRVMAPVILVGLAVTIFLPKPLNALLLGEEYARSMGVDVRWTRVFILLSASVLAGTVTAFCGPIGFIGVAVPHLCRNLLHSANHKSLLPAAALLGGALALLADAIAQLPGSQFVLPINVVTSLFGAPFVVWVIIKQRKGRTSFSV